MHTTRRIIPVLAATTIAVAVIAVAVATSPPARADLRTAVRHIGSSIVREGSMEACVYAYVGQGLPLAEAAKHCGVDVQGVPAGGDLPPTAGGSVAVDGFRNTAGGPLTVSCTGNSGADPRLGSEIDAARAARDKAKQALDAFDLSHPYPTGPDEGKRAQLSIELTKRQHEYNELSTDLVRREAEAKATKKMLEDAANGAALGALPPSPTQPPPPPAGVPEPSTAPTAPPPPPGPPAVIRPMTGIDQACLSFAAFVGECNLAGWATGPCQNLRKQLRGCVDSTIAYTTGDDPDAGCPADDPDAKTVAQVAQLRCSMVARVAPGYDPCGRPDLGGGPGRSANPSTDPCTGRNPWALTTGEGCEIVVDETSGIDLALRIDPRVVLLLGGPGVPTNGSVPPFVPGVK
jgi:hypothetical protein